MHKESLDVVRPGTQRLRGQQADARGDGQVLRTSLARGREQGKKTAWCTSVGPAELLRALGFNVYFPENHGAMLGAARMATDLIPLANARGFSPDICSYLTSDIGSYLKGETPLQKMGLQGLPQGRRAGVQHQPVPRREGLVPVLRAGVERAVPGHPHAAGDRRGGRPAGRLRGRADRGAGRRRWKQVAGTQARHRPPQRGHRPLAAVHAACGRRCWRRRPIVPSPITFFDGTIQMGPAVVLRGHQDAVDYYRCCWPS